VPPVNAAWMRISELSRRAGVSTDTLRAWERRYGLLKPRRSAGNARLYSPLDEARVRLMKRYIAQRIPPAQAAQLSMTTRLSLSPGSETKALSGEFESVRQDLRLALDEMDEFAADRTLQQLLVDHAVSDVLRHVILPYLHEVGERWAANHMTVAQEHFASNFFQFRLAALSRGWDRGLGPRAVLACAPEEQHTLGLICFGIALHRHGWRIAYLGATTPLEMVQWTAAKLEPNLIAICAYERSRLEPHMHELRETAERWRLALAGRGVDAELARSSGAELLNGDPVSSATKVALAV
jgi:MerR family transcriptional regulator, light-induced transcriptional regulator